MNTHVKDALTKVDIHTLNVLDMSSVLGKVEFKGFIDHQAGEQPYRMMKFLLDTMFNRKQAIKASIIGVGRDGHLATLCASEKAHVDVYEAYRNDRYCDEEPKALLKLSNVSMKPGFPGFDDIVKSDLIVFDMHPHDGVNEADFVRELVAKHYNGILVITCININNNMKQMWNAICQQKLDVSSKAHWAGTGVVFFEAAQVVPYEPKNDDITLYKQRALTAEKRLQELECIIQGLLMMPDDESGSDVSDDETAPMATLSSNLIDLDTDIQSNTSNDPFASMDWLL
jgi:hypothetical protein